MKKKESTTNETTNATLEKKRKTSSANYTMAMTALVLAFVIIVNLVVLSISTDYRQIDLTKGSVFTLSEQTEEFLDELDKDITIYMILENITNRNDDLHRLLEVYSDYSKHITLKTINPVQDPTFMENREYVSESSIIVEYGDKFKGVAIDQMYITSDDPNTGSTYIYYDMEGQITSALNYVITDDIPKAYMLKEPTRDTFDKSLLVEIKKQNIDIENISIIEKGEIPNDADIIILDQPVEDISNSEYDMLFDFMENGGSLLMFQYYNHNNETKMPNVEKLLDHYGLSVEYGVALETNKSYIYNSKSYNSRPILEEHEITKDLISTDTNLMVVMGDAIEIGDVPDSVKVEPLLTSTSSAYYKSGSAKNKDSNVSMAQLTSDKVGTFNYAVAVTDDISDDTQSRFIYVSSYSFAETDLYKDMIGSGNSTFVVKCMQWLANQDTTISIPMKSRTFGSLVYTLDARNRILYTVVIIIPAVVLGYGGYVWFRRRKR